MCTPVSKAIDTPWFYTLTRNTTDQNEIEHDRTHQHTIANHIAYNPEYVMQYIMYIIYDM